MATETLTPWKRLQNPNYIGAYSLDPNEERIIEITKVISETVKGPDGKEEQCIVAYLKNEKPMILNSTNCKTLTRLYNTPYIEQWVGKKAIIFAKKIKAFGEWVEALRIKDTVPSLPELTPTHEKWQGALKAIQDGTVTMEKLLSRFHISDENQTLLKTPNQ
jgi:hypothetical protein